MGRGSHRTLGDRGENIAYRFLIDQGLRPIARNFRCRGGEIDLIMLDRRCLTFIEVRCRRSTEFARPADTVDFRKQRKIVHTAAMFLGRERRYATFQMRFDVVAIEGDSVDGVRWIRDAFRPDDLGL